MSRKSRAKSSISTLNKAPLLKLRHGVVEPLHCYAPAWPAVEKLIFGLALSLATPTSKENRALAPPEAYFVSVRPALGNPWEFPFWNFFPQRSYLFLKNSAIQRLAPSNYGNDIPSLLTCPRSYCGRARLQPSNRTFGGGHTQCPRASDATFNPTSLHRAACVSSRTRRPLCS